MAQYQFITQARNGSAITDLTNLIDRRIDLYLNRPCEITGKIRADDDTIVSNVASGLVPGINELMAYRGASPLETVYQLASVDVDVDTDSPQLTFKWLGIMSYLQDALVLGQKSAYSGTTLPWTWINTFQSRTGASVYGLANGVQTGSPPTRSRLLEQDGTLMDEIAHLSETSSGFDFNVDSSRLWNEWHTQRGSSNGLVLEYGTNVSSYGYGESVAPGEVVSDARVIGPPGSGVGTATSSTAQSTYGRREASLSYLTELENATVTSSQLTNFATAAIAQRAAPLIIPRVQLRRNHDSVAWGTYDLGDTVTFQAAVGNYTTINAQYRIVAIHIELDDANNETVSLDLNAV